MRVDFEIGAFKFMYVGNEGNEDKALQLFLQMTDQVGKILSPEIVQSLVAADPAVVEAIKEATIRDFGRKFDEQVVAPVNDIATEHIVIRTAPEVASEITPTGLEDEDDYAWK